MKARLCWHIGDGKNIYVYKDHWIPKPVSFQPVSPKTLPMDTKVPELINSNGTWNIPLIQNQFLLLDAETITHIPLSPHPCPDQVYWFYDKRGVYTAKREYQLALLLNHYQGPSTLSSSQAWWKFIWSLSIPLKMRIFLW